MATTSEAAATINRPGDGPDVDELRAQTVFGSALAVGVLGVGVFYLAALGLKQVDFGLFVLSAELVALASGIFVVSRRWSGAAGLLGVGGLFATLIVNLSSATELALAPWLSLVVFLAVAVLGRPAGVGVAVAVTLTFLPMFHFVPDELPASLALSTVFLSWASLGFSWLIARPTQVALAWSWESYIRARDQTEKARERQAELARLSKTLSESYYQLEQLNLELERARRAAQDARQLKAQFAAAVSHELRTPLNLVIGFCEMMVLSPSAAYGERLPANYQRDLEAIYRNACHISALVDDILDLSQIDADRMALHKEWISLDQVVDEAVATVDGLFRERRLFLDTIVGDDLPVIHADPTRVRQILINLLGNAARFTERGGVTVRVDPAGGGALVSVQDTGPGISPEQVSHVFEEFFQITSGPPRRAGSGLGLTVSRRFAELHGGRMGVESEVGVGTTFFLWLPRSAEPTLAVPEAVDWDARRRARVRGNSEKRILVVDPDGEVSRLLGRYLDGFQVLHLAELPTSHQLARFAPLRAIILGSPDGSGECLALSQEVPALRRVPVIACATRTRRSAAEEIGAVGYLVKPITRSQLRVVLRGLGRPTHRAIVVDDDPEMAHLLVRMVRSVTRGCQVEVAADGVTALEKMRSCVPDVALLDLLMPGMNGSQVLERMKDDPALENVPVVVVSAQDPGHVAFAVEDIQISQPSGIPLNELVRWLKAGLVDPAEERTAGERRAEPLASPVWPETRRRQGSAPALSPEGSSRRRSEFADQRPAGEAPREPPSRPPTAASRQE